MHNNLHPASVTHIRYDFFQYDFPRDWILKIFNATCGNLYYPLYPLLRNKISCFSRSDSPSNTFCKNLTSHMFWALQVSQLLQLIETGSTDLKLHVNHSSKHSKGIWSDNQFDFQMHILPSFILWQAILNFVWKKNFWIHHFIESINFLFCWTRVLTDLCTILLNYVATSVFALFNSFFKKIAS